MKNLMLYGMLLSMFVLTSCLSSERKNAGDVMAVNYSGNVGSSSSEQMSSSVSSSTSDSSVILSSNSTTSSSSTVLSSSIVSSSSVTLLSSSVNSSSAGLSSSLSSSSSVALSSSLASSSSALSSSFGTSSGTLTDSRDGKIYKTVVIGTQTWMAENLNYDTADGTGSWCYGNLPANCDTYGRLYDWNMVMAGASTSSANPSGVRGVCPESWHVPSDNEWEVMAQYVADQTGNNSKSGDDWIQLGVNLTATSGWNSSGNGTDDFGFSALPAGIYSGGIFYYEGSSAYFWSATENDASFVWGRNLRSEDETLSRGSSSKLSGFSSRCVQDF